jgi:hypothetical protein
LKKKQEEVDNFRLILQQQMDLNKLKRTLAKQEDLPPVTMLQGLSIANKRVSKAQKQAI